MKVDREFESHPFRTSASSVQAEHNNRKIMWYVNLLLCDQETFYVGMTNDPKERLIEHRTGKSLFTKKFSDIKFVFCEKHPDKYRAALREKQIKGWSRTKKQILIDGKLGYNVCAELAEVLGGSDDLP